MHRSERRADLVKIIKPHSRHISKFRLVLEGSSYHMSHPNAEPEGFEGLNVGLMAHRFANNALFHPEGIRYDFTTIARERYMFIGTGENRIRSHVEPVTAITLQRFVDQYERALK